MNHKYLGWANAWSAVIWTLPNGSKRYEKPDTTPPEYTRCVEQNHKTHELCKGPHWYKVYCDECKITWEYDCS